jgi:hypothetical protein
MFASIYWTWEVQLAVQMPTAPLQALDSSSLGQAKLRFWDSRQSAFCSYDYGEPRVWGKKHRIVPIYKEGNSY